MELNKLHVWVILQSGLTHQNKGSQSSTGIRTGTSTGVFFNTYGCKYGYRVFTFLLHVPYTGWSKTLGGHVRRLVEDTRGTCT